MFAKGQNVYINDTQSRFHGMKAVVIKNNGDCYDVQLHCSLRLRVVPAQLMA